MEFKSRGRPLPEDVKGHGDRRLHLALSRFSNRIRSVKVQVDEVEGPRSGADQKVSIALKLDPGDTLVVEDVGSDLKFILESAVDRLGRLVARELDRQRQASAQRGSRFSGTR